MTHQYEHRPTDAEQRFKRLLEAVTDYVYRVTVVDGNPVYTIHGAGCEAVTGYTREEFANNSLLWIAMVPLKDRPVVERQAAEVLRGMHPSPVEHRIRHKNGQIRWVLNTVSPQYDAQGHLIAYDGLVRDITERKEAEEAVRRLKNTLEERVAEQTQEIRLLAEAVSHLGEGVIITDAQLEMPGPRIVFVNEAICRITGYTREELIGHTPRILQCGKTDRETLDRIKGELSAGRSCAAEMINTRKNGEHYHAELFITPLFDADGTRTNFVSVHRDITKRKNTEKALRDREMRLRAVLTTAADAIVTIDREGNINSVNPATERMFGYSEDELVGRNVRILMPPPYREEHDSYIERYLQTGEPRIIGFGRELVGQRKDGATFPIGLAVSESENLGMFTGIVRDMSKVKQLQQHVLEIAAREHRRIGQELHDGTGQELTALSLFAESLRDEFAAAEPAFDHASCQRMKQTIERLCEGLAATNRHVHQLSHGIMPVQIEAEGLRSALEELATATDSQRGITCEFHCRATMAIPDNTTATHLYRIAQEALNNAIRHGKAERIELTLGQDHRGISLEVADNGCGFDPQTPRDSRANGMGLQTMEYRAGLIGGVLELERLNQGGMLVRCTILNGSTSHG